MNSTAGYNHFEVAEYMLESGADVNAQDKGGLIPLHNASSYGVSLTILQRMREAKIKRIRVQMHKRLLRK